MLGVAIPVVVTKTVVHVGGREPGLSERVADRGLAEVDRGPRPGLVAAREGRQLPVPGERQRQVPPRHLDGAVELLQTLRVEVGSGPGVAKGREERLLVGVVLRKRPSHGMDPDGGRGGRPRTLGLHGRDVSRTWPWPVFDSVGPA